MASLFATCFINTIIFMRLSTTRSLVFGLWSLVFGLWSLIFGLSFQGQRPKTKDLFFVSLKQQRRVRAAKPEAVRERIIQMSFARLIGNIIEVAFGIGSDVVNRRQQHVAMNCEH